MNYLTKLLMITFMFLLTGCYPGINGKIVDGVTGNPLAGAVVLAQWTTTGGLPGLTHHSVYKIEETETDKEGKFYMSGVYNPFVDPPKMVIYKKGFVPWRNDRDFMNHTWELYDDIIWRNGMTYRLAHWREEYSKHMLDGFIDVGLIGANATSTPKFSDIKSEIGKEAQPEIELMWKPKK